MAEVARLWSSFAAARSRSSRCSFISWPARFLAVRSASRAFFSPLMAARRSRKAPPLLRQCLQLPFQRLDLRLGVGDVLPVGLHRPLLLGPVAGEVRAQGAQVRGAAGRRLPLGGQSRQGALLGADLLRQGAGLLQQLRLAGEGGLRPGAQVRGGGFLSLDLLLSGGDALFVVRQPAGQTRQLAGQVLQVFLQRAQQDVKMALGALQPEDLVLRLTALGLRRLQLVLGRRRAPGPRPPPPSGRR